MKKLPPRALVALRLDLKLKERLDRIADKEHRSVNSLIAAILLDWLNNPKRDR